MSSKRRLRRKSCEGKQRHADLTAATSHLRSLLASKGMHKNASGFSAYHCRFCCGYHVGHARGYTKA